MAETEQELTARQLSDLHIAEQLVSKDEVVAVSSFVGGLYPHQNTELIYEDKGWADDLPWAGQK